MSDREQDQMNPFLAESAADGETRKGSPQSIQDPQKPENLVWQTRDRVPTAFEDALGYALEKTFAAGIKDLPEIVERLNRDGPKPDAGEWTEELFQAEIKRLGR